MNPIVNMEHGDSKKEEEKSLLFFVLSSFFLRSFFVRSPVLFLLTHPQFFFDIVPKWKWELKERLEGR